jgi:AraC-like DNA-binding protein
MRVQPYLGQRKTRIEELGNGELRLGISNRDPEDRPGARIEAELAGVVMHDVVLHFFADASHARPVLEFPFATPEDTRPYRHMFPGGVRFSGEGTFVYCPRSALAPRRSGADPGLIDHLLNLALTQYGAGNTAEDWTSRVRCALNAQAAPRQLDATALADQLGVSVRGLSRRLSREGSSLTSLLDEALYERAQRLLQRPGATAAQVAEALGYAELSSFFRAFRRWSGGLTPSAYRRHHLGPRVA